MAKKNSTSKKQFVLRTDEEIIKATRQRIKKYVGDDEGTQIFIKHFLMPTLEKDAAKNALDEFNVYVAKRINARLKKKKIAYRPNLIPNSISIP